MLKDCLLNDFFLKYANYSVLADPEPLEMFAYDLSYFDQEHSYISEYVDEYSDVSRAVVFMAKNMSVELRRGFFDIECLLTIARDTPYLERKKLIAKLKKGHWLDGFGGAMEHFLEVYDDAFQSVTSLPDCQTRHLYPSESSICTIRRRTMDPLLFEGANGLRCYACDQIHFVKILSEIVAGTDLASIDGFEILLHVQNEATVHRKLKSIAPQKKGTSNTTQGQLAQMEIVEIPLMKAVGSEVPGIPSYPWDMSPFRISILSAAVYSLTEFLLKGSRSLLKRCHNCGRFYIAKTRRSNQKFCSDKCRWKEKWTEEDWAEKMREYRKKWAKERALARDAMRESEIKRRMDLFPDCTREEIIAQMEDD